jgi:hypothetical protein
MEDFLLENYSFLTKVVEITACVTGLIVLKKFKTTNVRFFIYFLVYVALIELLGAYPIYFRDFEVLSPLKQYVKGTLIERNYWWYNIFWNFGSALFYAFYFYKIIETKLYKAIIRFCGVLFIVSIIVYTAIYPNKLFENTVILNTNLGAFLILIAISLYFLEILKSKKILFFYKSVNFYIAIIVFIWFLVLTPLVFYNVYFSTADWSFIFLKWQIFLFMNIFMYLGFTVALLYCKPQKSME